MPHSKYWHIEPGQGMKSVPTLTEALRASKRAGYIWIDLHEPTRAVLDTLAEALGLHPLAVEDCLDDNQVPKVEHYPGHTFVIFNRYSYGNQELNVTEVDFFLGKSFVVSVSGNGGQACASYERVENLVRLDSSNVERGPDALLHLIMDQTVDSKIAPIAALEDDIEAAEESIIADATAFRLENLVALRRALLTLRKSLFHEREILAMICRRDSPQISEAAIYHFRDIYDHLTKFFEVTEMNRDILTGLMEMYLSLINNRMAEVANRTNNTVRRLTLITTIFMPLTLLSGIGGMSEWSMMTGAQNWKVSYPLFLLAMVLIAIVTYVILKRVQRKD